MQPGSRSLTGTSRRAFLAGAGGVGLGALPGSQRPWPTRPRPVGPLAGDGRGERRAVPLRHSVDHVANGFDPSATVRDFDYGRTTIGPDGRTVREWEIVAEDREIEVAPGVRFPAWTFNGRIPGPTLRCTQGDVLRVRFVNGSEHPHTMHFHGIHPAEMDGVQMVGRGIISPGEEFTDTVVQAQGQRGICEVRFPNPGRFMFHAHKTEFADLGWMGMFEVVGEGTL